MPASAVIEENPLSRVLEAEPEIPVSEKNLRPQEIGFRLDPQPRERQVGTARRFQAV
jgi:hypothetical protein